MAAYVWWFLIVGLAIGGTIVAALSMDTSRREEDLEADAIADRMFLDPEHALDTLVREELGLDPDELGSPWGAAFGSFVAFAAGAAVPVIPYLVVRTGTAPFAGSIGLSIAALFAVGAGVSLLTGRGTVFSGLRQVLIGGGAAIVTYVVGLAVGVGVNA